MLGFGSAQAARRLHHATRGMAAPTAPPTGVFFDSTGEDGFDDLLYTAQPEMSVAADGLSFAKTSAGALGMDLAIPAPNGSALKLAFDRLELDATFKITGAYNLGTSFFHFGLLNDVLGLHTAEMRAHPSNLANLFGTLFNTDRQRQVGSSHSNAAGDFDCRIRYRRLGGTSEFLLTVEGVDQPPLVLTHTVTATSDETPRLFSTPILRAENGAWTCSALKLSAMHPGARFAFLGDSLFGSRLAGSYDDGAPQLLRADHPDDVIVASAPGAKTTDWLAPAALDPFVAMRPRTAFVLLGVNDLTGGATVTQLQSNLATIVATLENAGIAPVVLTLPPINHGFVETVNSWIATQGWNVLDIFTELRDPAATGNPKLKAQYNSGDGVHWTSAANLAVYNLLTTHIAAGGL